MDCCAGRAVEALRKLGEGVGEPPVVPRVLDIWAAPQAPLNTLVCLHAGFILATGCWHFDVF